MQNNNQKTKCGRILISLGGTQLSDEEKKILSHKAILGVFLLKQNCVDHIQIQNLVNEIKETAVDSGKTEGMAIFVDQEGGTVKRIPPFNGELPLKAFHEIGKKYNTNKKEGLDLAYHEGARMAKQLFELGGLIALTPVLDIHSDNSVIIGKRGRAFHTDPNVCIELAVEYVNGVRSVGMYSMGKHYPGHGSVVGDSHTNELTDDRTLDEIIKKDLKPFEALIQQDLLKAIMPAHIKYSQVDKDNLVLMSSVWIEDILRKRLGFDGIIVTDGLGMSGAGNDSNLDKITKALARDDHVIALMSALPAAYNAILEELDIQYHQMTPKVEKKYLEWIDGIEGKFRIKRLNIERVSDSIKEMEEVDN